MAIYDNKNEEKDVLNDISNESLKKDIVSIRKQVEELTKSVNELKQQLQDRNDFMEKYLNYTRSKKEKAPTRTM